MPRCRDRRTFAASEPQRTERLGAPLRGVENRPTAAGSRHGVGSGAPSVVPASVGPPGAPNVIGESAPTPPATAAGRFTHFAVTPLRSRPAPPSPLRLGPIGNSQARHRRAAQGERIRSTLSAATRERGKTLPERLRSGGPADSSPAVESLRGRTDAGCRADHPRGRRHRQPRRAGAFFRGAKGDPETLALCRASRAARMA